MSMSIIVKMVCNYSIVLAFWVRIVALTLFPKDRHYKLWAWWITLRIYEEQCLLLIGLWDTQAFCLWTSATDLENNLYIAAQHEWELLYQHVVCCAGCVCVWNTGLVKVNPTFHAISFLFFYPCNLQCCLNVWMGYLRRWLVFNRVCYSSFHDIVWLVI